MLFIRSKISLTWKIVLNFNHQPLWLLTGLLGFRWRYLGIEFENTIGRKRKSISKNRILGWSSIHNTLCYFIPMAFTIPFNFSRHWKHQRFFSFFCKRSFDHNSDHCNFNYLNNSANDLLFSFLDCTVVQLRKLKNQTIKSWRVSKDSN